LPARLSVRLHLSLSTVQGRICFFGRRCCCCSTIHSYILLLHAPVTLRARDEPLHAPKGPRIPRPPGSDAYLNSRCCSSSHSFTRITLSGRRASGRAAAERLAPNPVTLASPINTRNPEILVTTNRRAPHCDSCVSIRAHPLSCPSVGERSSFSCIPAISSPSAPLSLCPLECPPLARCSNPAGASL
jgi:hypothetical protein